MRTLLIFIFSFIAFNLSKRVTAQTDGSDATLFSKFDSREFSSVSTVKELSDQLKPLAGTKKESLLLLYFWTYKYMSVDTARFYNRTAPLTISQSLKQKKGMCEEFSTIFYEYCRINQIPCFKVEGYVRPVGFSPGKPFEEGNHIWNAVFLDSQWYVCDLLWSVSTLRVGRNTRFVKEAKPAFFLASPSSFQATHLPLSPVFQFSDHPVSMEAFTNVENGIDTLVKKVSTPFNYKDSIRVLLALNEQDRSIKVAKQAFVYNKSNPNQLIINAYNNAIEIVNRSNANTADLRKARTLLLLAIDHFRFSKVRAIRDLKEPCSQALAYVNKRMGAATATQNRRGK